MVHVAAPGLDCRFLVVVVLGDQSAGFAFVQADNNFAIRSGFDAVAFRINDIHVVQRHGLAHGAYLVRTSAKVADHQRGLALSKPFHELQPRGLLHLAEDFRVERFARDGRVLHARKVVV
ncbi:hypothetical protein SDC9_107993 [bioreactor metagenome]|uniref:Uncharacterized protein n=1 Tax=bioreactor metagenome TaxID=1076179 RepID=A0A645B6Q2_9ZZZZ